MRITLVFCIFAVALFAALERADSRLAPRLSFNQEGTIKATPEKSSSSEVKSNHDLDVLFELKDLRNFPASRDQYDTKLKQLSDKDTGLKLMQEILLSPEMQKRKDQALLRIGAIDTLEYAAMRGNIRPLEEVISKLRSTLETQAEVKKGQTADLSDCISAWINAQGKEQVAQNLTLLTDRFPYRSGNTDFPSHVWKEAFATALWNSFGDKMKQSPLKEQIDELVSM